MASLTLIEGPAGSGKSQEVRRMLERGDLDIVADLTALWAALRGIERDPQTGRYPIRTDDDVGVGMAQYMRAAAVRQGLREGLDVGVTSGTPNTVTRWQGIAAETGAGFRVRTIDPGESVVRERLAEFGGSPDALTPQCESAVRRWYG